MPDRSFLLVHGFNHHRPAGHWQYWLAYRLRALGEPVFYPGLPFEDDPRYVEWRQALTGELAEMGGERVVICNSLACLLWFRYAADRAAGDAPVDRLLLVSPPDSPQVPDKAASFRMDDVEGYGPWPALEAWCLDPARRIGPNFA